ncbi:molybdopterin-guanine dinucleotide biosynthesis protein B [Aquibacillus kalidii]|uniref:molybdopterin-guanine dinucleotide biosynthesis protein B n=1 Tax=Aquibacillus kalidii TaxID=2762597 RepID=UPI0016458F9B|nr:molybdopterin-guanine dinucleotide biosynthesis protein B [Aquibacillus kalidii]
MKIIQVVGYKNSGKTTVSSGIIKMLTKKGYRVASLKHHGHGGVPLGLEDTDSERHLRAGSVLAGVEGEGHLNLSVQDMDWNMESLIGIYRAMHTEILVIEGFKQHNFGKIVLLRNQEDSHLLNNSSNIKAILAEETLENVTHPIFHNNNDLYNWVENNLSIFKNH